MSNLAENRSFENGVKGSPVPNVVGFYNDSPQADINNFMKLKEMDSKNTVTTYWNHYKHMFMYLTGKEISQLNWNDIKLITMKRVKDYRANIIGEFANTTINQRIYACKRLWQEFIENERVYSNVFDLEDLPQEKNSYDALTRKEIDLLFDYCLNLKYKPKTQMLYFKFLFTVACRKNTAQKITWDDIIRKQDELGNEFWVVKFHEKKKDHERAITDEFYQQLKDNYNENQETSGRVFSVNNHTYDSTLKDFCKKYNITKNIVQHSIRSSASDNIQNILGDINVTAKALGHDNIQTTYSKYMNKINDFANQPSYMLDKDYSIDKLRGLGEEELLRLIEIAGKETITKLCLELEKMNK